MKKSNLVKTVEKPVKKLAKKVKVAKKTKVVKNKYSKLDYVICSSRLDIYCGYLVEIADKHLTLVNAREIAGVGCSFEKFEMANNGMSIVKGIRFSPEIEKITIGSPCEIIKVKKEMVDSIKNEPSYVIPYKD